MKLWRGLATPLSVFSFVSGWCELRTMKVASPILPMDPCNEVLEHRSNQGSLVSHAAKKLFSNSNKNSLWAMQAAGRKRNKSLELEILCKLISGCVIPFIHEIIQYPPDRCLKDPLPPLQMPSQADGLRLCKKEREG